MRTVIYARVSTEDQLERYGLPTQLRACREYAERNGLTVISEITDDGISGTILERRGLDQVRTMARAGELDVVLMLDVDRLSRELSHLLILKPELEKRARLEFVTAKFEDSPSGRMFFGIRGVIAQYERELTRERTMRGRRERARSGLIVGGRTPYGYTYEAGQLLEDPDRSPVVRRIYASYEQGMTLRGITRMLRASGCPTWGKGKWGKSSVNRILRNETYAGIAHYGTHRREGKLIRLRESEDRIALSVPALVTREQWDGVQARLNSNDWVGRPSQNFLLRGILYCSKCSRRMNGESSRKSRSYRCSGRDPMRVSGGICRNHVAVDALDRAVWSELVRTFTDADVLTSLLRKHETELREMDPAKAEELRRGVAKQRRREEAALSNLLDPDLAEERVTIKAEYKAASAERRRLENELARIEAAQCPAPEDWIKETVSLLRQFGFAEGTPKQEFIRRLIRRAEWNGEEIRMFCFIGAQLARSSARSSQFSGAQIVVTARVAA